MSYQAIARKWRPTTFDEIAGQGHVTRTLTNALTLGRIHHAFLFTGARGVGKTTAARTLSRCLNCHKGPTPTPCGTCPSCIDLGRGNSSDVTEIDGASNNSVEDVRALRDSVRYLPSRDKYRVYIIDEVHMLSIGAFNALLKTLEEPPDHVVFIFATTEPQKIPDTILSRVQRFDFKRIPTQTVVKRLRTIIDAEGIEIPDEGLRLIARAGEGSMRDAQSLLDQVIAFGGENVDTDQVAKILGLVDRGLLFGFLEGLTQAQPEKCLDSIAAVYDYGYELSQFTSELLELLRNAALTVLSPAARKHVDAPAEELERLAALCKGLDAETFSRWFQVMLAVHDEVARSSRPRLVLEMAVARLVTVRPVQPVAHLVSRLEGLERTMRQGGVRPSARGPRARDARSNGGSAQGEGDDLPSARPRPGASRAAETAPSPSAQQRTPERPAAPQPASKAPATPTAKPAPQTAPKPTAKRAPQTAPKPAAKPAPRAAPKPMGKESPPPELHTESTASRLDDVPPPQAPLGMLDNNDTEIPVALPMPLPPGASEESRYAALQAWLAPQRAKYWAAAENTALIGVENHTLQIVAPGEAAVLRFKKVAQDPFLLQAIGIIFPGVTALSARLRAEGDQDRLTRREIRAKMLAAHRLVLLEQAAQDPIVLRAIKALDAKLIDLIPLSDPEGLP